MIYKRNFAKSAIYNIIYTVLWLGTKLVQFLTSFRKNCNCFEKIPKLHKKAQYHMKNLKKIGTFTLKSVWYTFSRFSEIRYSLGALHINIKVQKAFIKNQPI